MTKLSDMSKTELLEKAKELIKDNPAKSKELGVSLIKIFTALKPLRCIPINYSISNFANDINGSKYKHSLVYYFHNYGKILAKEFLADVKKNKDPAQKVKELEEKIQKLEYQKASLGKNFNELKEKYNVLLSKLTAIKVHVSDL